MNITPISLWFMVDITIVFMGFINQQTSLGGTILWYRMIMHMWACLNSGSPQTMPDIKSGVCHVAEMGLRKSLMKMDCTCSCIYVYMYVHMYVSIYLCIYVSMYLCMYECIFIHDYHLGKLHHFTTLKSSAMAGDDSPNPIPMIPGSVTT